MTNDNLRAKLARYGYQPKGHDEPYSPDPIEIIEDTPGKLAAIDPDVIADKLEARITLIREAADLCASDNDWLALFETFVEEALNRG